MYLKIEIQGKEQIYSFPDTSTIKIGRSPSSDIQLVEDGISRNHVEIRAKQGDYFLVDLNSTNGSFINDDQIEAGKEIPFNSFFPVKLGFYVLLHLLDEVSEEQLARVISKGDQQNDVANTGHTGQTKTIAKKKKSSGQTRKVKLGGGTGSRKVKTSGPKKDLTPWEQFLEHPQVKKIRRRFSENVLYPLILAGAIGGGLWYLTGGMDEPVPVVENKPAAKRKKKESKPKVSQVNMKLEAESAIRRDKCLGRIEKEYCDKLKNFRNITYYEGFYKSLDTMFLMIDIESAMKGYQYKLIVDDKIRQEAIGMVNKYYRRQMSAQQFEENKYRLHPLKIGEETYSAAFYTDLIFTNIVQTLANDRGIKKLVVGIFDANSLGLLSHRVFGSEELKSIPFDQLKGPVRLFWATSGYIPLQRALRDLGGNKSSSKNRRRKRRSRSK